MSNDTQDTVEDSTIKTEVRQKRVGRPAANTKVENALMPEIVDIKERLIRMEEMFKEAVALGVNKRQEQDIQPKDGFNKFKTLMSSMGNLLENGGKKLTAKGTDGAYLIAGAANSIASAFGVFTQTVSPFIEESLKRVDNVIMYGGQDGDRKMAKNAITFFLQDIGSSIEDGVLVEGSEMEIMNTAVKRGMGLWNSIHVDLGENKNRFWHQEDALNLVGKVKEKLTSCCAISSISGDIKNKDPNVLALRKFAIAKRLKYEDVEASVLRGDFSEKYSQQITNTVFDVNTNPGESKESLAKKAIVFANACDLYSHYMSCVFIKQMDELVVNDVSLPKWVRKEILSRSENLVVASDDEGQITYREIERIAKESPQYKDASAMIAEIRASSGSVKKSTATSLKR